MQCDRNMHEANAALMFCHGLPIGFHLAQPNKDQRVEKQQCP
jgi:hypothetical protein